MTVHGLVCQFACELKSAWKTVVRNHARRNFLLCSLHIICKRTLDALRHSFTEGNYSRAQLWINNMHRCTNMHTDRIQIYVCIQVCAYDIHNILLCRYIQLSPLQCVMETLTPTLILFSWDKTLHWGMFNIHHTRKPKSGILWSIRGGQGRAQATTG